MNMPIQYSGLEGYTATELGEVVGKDGVTKIAQFKNSRGYWQVGLYVRGVGKKTFAVHRLVALAFMPTDDTSLDVDHIDNNKENNHVSNLQWLTRAKNVAKSFKQGREGSRKGKLMGKNMMFYISTENERRLRSIQEADGSMSGAVNRALDAALGEVPETTPPPKMGEPVPFEGTPEHPRFTQAVCKNGHSIPEGRSRCMGKGCKYA